MADEEDKSQKTEEATPKRIEDSRKKGQVPSSKEPSTALAFLTLASLGVTGVGAWSIMLIEDLMRDCFSGRLTLQMDAQGMQLLLERLANDIGLMIIPIVVPIMLIGMLVTALVSGPVFTFETLKPKFEKVSPIKGLGRLFSTKSLAEFVKSLVKLCVITLACWFVIVDLLPEALLATRQGPESVAILAVDGSLKIAALVALIFFLIALADVVYQRWEFAKSMRMAQKEIRDEHKETEGDPQLKAKIRQIQMEQARNRMMADVPQADVVITNPTHIAVALQYDKNGLGAPKVVAKGRGKIAEKIREIAREHRIPIRENKPLARSLFKVVKIGREIPAELFEAVAIILAEIYKMRNTRKA
ncbi:MAG: flagellar biosynthesis protein FlhB [Mariprofundaceae bacterium]